MKKTWIILSLMTLLLAACQIVPPTPVAAPTFTPLPKAQPTQTAAPSLSPTPVATVQPSLPPALTATVGSQTRPTETANCADFPGWHACHLNDAKLPLTGMLAWISATSGQLTGADFSSGKAWYSSAVGVTRLAWKPDKTQLLAVDPDGALIYPAAGGSAARAADKSAQGWLPGGSALPGGWVANASGGSAHLEVKDGQTLIKINPSIYSSVITTFPLTPATSDKVFSLLAWLPKSDLVLGQAYYAANSMWMPGGQLFTLDAKSGVVKFFEAYTPLGAVPAAHPSQPGLVALAESSAGGQRLATLDSLTGKLTVLTTDESVFVSRPAWTLDGKALLFAAWGLPLEKPAGAPFDLRAIYLTSPTGGALVRLTQPAVGSLDDQPLMLAGGKYFLFTRRAADGKSAELRLGGLDGITDLPLVKGVLLPACQPQPGCAQATWSYMD